jgi:hypothetical protein
MIAALGAMVTGAVLVGGVALAQTPTPTPSATPSGQGQTQQQDGLGSFFLDQLAKNLGISRSQLESAAKAAGNSTVDEALRLGRINQDQANRMHERINQGNGFFSGFLDRMGERRMGPGGHAGAGLRMAGGVLKAIADQLHIDQQTLMSQLRSGKTLKEIAAAATPPVTDLNTLKPGIKSAVQAELQGRGVSQDRINVALQRIDNMDLNQFGAGRMGPRGGRN